MSPETYPSQRPMEIIEDALGEASDGDRSPHVTSIPWIDPHQHTQTVSWDDLHNFDLTGCQAVVMIAQNPQWSPYRPVEPSDVRFLWDLAIKWIDLLDAKHHFDSYTAIGIHTLARVDDWEELLQILPEYLSLAEVVAVGETGIDPVQYGTHWPVADQRDLVRQQMSIAGKAGLPIIIHTPSKKSGAGAESEGWGGVGLTAPDPEIDYSQPKLECTEIDIELMDQAGIDDDQVVIDHGAPSIIDLVMEQTNCYLSFSVSNPRKGVTSSDIAEAIHTYGPDRFLIDSDVIGYRHSDMFCVPETILDLHEHGVSIEDIRTVVYDNPRDVLGIDIE